MSGLKRRLSTDGDGQSSKRPLIVDDDGDDDLEAILLQIKQQEASEALAHSLQHKESVVYTPSPKVASSSSCAPPESDEDMARRLAREWAEQDQGHSDLEILPDPSVSGGHAEEVQASSSSAGRNRSSGDVTDAPPDELLQPFRDFFTGHKLCAGCGANMDSPRGHVMFSSHIPPPSLTRLLHICCAQCKTTHCRGCLKVTTCPPNCRGPERNTGCTVGTCCAEVRAIALFEALGGFDRQYIGERIVSNSRAKDIASKRKSSSRSVGPGGTGYGTDHRYSGFHPDMDYSASGRGRGQPPDAGLGKEREALAAHWEDVVSRALRTITVYLPAPYADEPQVYDMLPHASLGPLLALSQLPDLLGDLLRNDSVTDWAARGDTYRAMLALLRRMGDCEVTIGVLVQERWERRDRSDGLEEWMWGEAEIVWEREGKGEDGDGEGNIARGAPLYDCFKKLTRQCEAFLSGAAELLDEGQDEDEEHDTTVKTVSLCGDIIAARDDIDRAMAVLGKSSSDVGKGKGKAMDPLARMEETYARLCEGLAFKHTSLSVDDQHGQLRYPTFNYQGDVNSSARSTRNPKDRLRLIKELSTMSTSLPPGVWVRVDEVRNDIIKIMMAGPDGTPYAGGLFEFDCFIPLAYPHTPPLVHLRTTANGRVRFNPNLYANVRKLVPSRLTIEQFTGQGLVRNLAVNQFESQQFVIFLSSLSLLGTWPGSPEEQWNSATSTLIQVIISIQAMILVDVPYFNEPGHGKANPKDRRSVIYNKHIALQTVRWGMIEWMQDEHRHGPWGDVIVAHFNTRGAYIRRCVEKWAAADKRLFAYSINSTSSAGGWQDENSVHRYNGSLGFNDHDMDFEGEEDYVYIPAKTQVKRGRKKGGASLSGEMDLLAAYDQGLEAIKHWKVDMESK